MSEKAPVQIEPLSNKEKEARNIPAVEEDADYPTDWKKKAKKISDAVDKGAKYYKRNVRGIIYMVLRKGKKDLSIGQWSLEREAKLFHFYPYLGTCAGIPKPVPFGSQSQGPHGYLSIPLNRIAVIPREYVPTINVIRYYQIIVANGFPGDFSQFINDIVTHHMEDCHGMTLPVMLEEEMEYRREGEEEIVKVPRIR